MPILRTLPVKDPQQIAVVQLADLTRWQGRCTSGYPAGRGRFVRSLLRS